MRQEYREIEKGFNILQEIEKSFPLEIKKLTDKYEQCVAEMKKY